MSRAWTRAEQDAESARWAAAIRRTDTNRTRPPVEVGPGPHGLRFPWLAVIVIVVGVGGFLLGLYL